MLLRKNQIIKLNLSAVVIDCTNGWSSVIDKMRVKINDIRHLMRAKV